MLALCNVVGMHDEPDIAADALLEFGFKDGEIGAMNLGSHDMAALEKMAEDRPNVAKLLYPALPQKTPASDRPNSDAFGHSDAQSA